MGIYQGDVYVMLKPRSQWPKARTKEQLVEAMARDLGKFPGVAYNFTQPMAMRLDEVVSGVKADVAVKIFGEDERVLNDKSEQVLRILARVPGAADVQKEVFAGAAEWQVQLNRPELARYGLNVSDVRDVIESAVGGRWATEVIEGRSGLPWSARLSRIGTGRHSATAAKPDGALVLLSQVAEMRQLQSPEIINREDGQRRMVVQSNVRGRWQFRYHKLTEDERDTPARLLHRWGGRFESKSAMAWLSSCPL
jgi:cobalt-zinc-cadmium resistance protein CzcA